MKKSLASRKCKCGKHGTYWYSYELALWLKLQPWEGTYLCAKCMKKIEKEWSEARKASDAEVSVG